MQVTAAQAFGDVGKLLGRGTISDQQQGARHFFGIEQLFCLIDHANNVFTRLLKQIGRQRLQEGVEQYRVFSGRQHQVGAAGVGDQRCACPGTPLNQVMELVFSREQPRRRYVISIHGRRQVDCQDQRRAIVEKVRRVLGPGRPGSGHGAQAKQHRKQVNRTHTLVIVRGDQQGAQQMRSNQPFELTLEVMAARPAPGQQDCRDNQQQPPGAQKVKSAEVDVHASTSGLFAWRSNC
ncbi:hypothetical protein D3C77_337240 [compost metagenome]